MVPDIAFGEPGDLAGRAAHDNHRLDIDVATLSDLDGLVGIVFQRDRHAAAQAFIGGDDDRGVAVADTAGQCVGRKTAAAFTAPMTEDAAFLPSIIVACAMSQPMRSDANEPGLAGNTTVRLPLMKVR